MNKKILVIPIIIAAILLALPYIIYADSFVMYQNSDAMYPAIFPGDLLIIEKSEINDVVVDDIIAFSTHIEGVDVLVRRVIEASFGNDGQFGLDTQGDDEEFHDPWTVYSDGYIGRLVEINPPLGMLFSDHFRYPIVIVIVISAVLLIRESIPKKGMEIKELHCLRCDYRWHPRIINGKAKIPSTCPKKECRSPYWNKPRQKES